MELNGKRNVETDPATLWNMLMDIEILPKIVPGFQNWKRQERIHINPHLK